MGTGAVLYHQHRLVNLARAISTVARLDAGKCRPLIQNIVNQQHHPVTRILVGSRNPLKLAALQTIFVTGGMNVVDLQRKLQLG